jgi:hypothetical protein
MEHHRQGALPGMANAAAKDLASLRQNGPWFKGSAVVDGEGRPKVLYHGTSADFTRFAPSPGGIWLAEDPAHAALFARIRQGAGRILPLHVSIRRPWVHIRYSEDTPYSQMVDQSIPALQARGYDGIYRPEDGAWAAFHPDQVRSALSPEPCETIEFECWFGASRVIDDRGVPLTVYHGTDEAFDRFSAAHAGRSTGHRSAVAGFFFSADPAVAALFPREIWSGWPLQRQIVPGHNIRACHLRIERPREITARDFVRRFVRGDDDAAAWRRELAASGHDGILVRGDAGLAERLGGDEFAADVWIAFEPEQIRSAWARSASQQLSTRQDPPDDATDTESPDGARERVRFSRGRASDLRLVGGDETEPDGDVHKLSSELTRRIHECPMRKAPAAAWLAFVRGLPKRGVKSQEIEWSGIEDWLAVQQDLRTELSREQVLGRLRAWGVHVRQVVRRSTGAPASAKRADGMAPAHELDPGLHDRIQEIDRALRLKFELAGYTVVEGEDQAFRGPQSSILGLHELPNHFQVAAERAAEQKQVVRNEGVLYADHVQPGAAHEYLEVLLVLPDRSERECAQDELDQFHARVRRRLGRPAIGLGEMTPHERIEHARLVRARDEARTDPGHLYFGPHWNETANVLAHVRLTVRADTELRRVLFIEEIQSDWAQEGRRQGFAEDAGKRQPAVVGAPTDQGVPVRLASGRTIWKADEDQARKTADEVNARGGSIVPGVPRAPFVTSTESWVTLVMKTMLRMAVQEGCDSVAWADGSSVARLFDLHERRLRSARIKRDHRAAPVVITTQETDLAGGTGAQSNPPGIEYRAYAFDDGAGDGLRPGSTRQGVRCGLESVLGRRLAHQVLRQLEDHDSVDIRLEELDLSPALDGMCSFYDEIVPAVASRVLAALGAAAAEHGQAATLSPVTLARMGHDGVSTVVAQGLEVTQRLREALLERSMTAFSRTAPGERSTQSQNSNLIAIWNDLEDWERQMLREKHAASAAPPTGESVARPRMRA